MPDVYIVLPQYQTDTWGSDETPTSPTLEGAMATIGNHHSLPQGIFKLVAVKHPTEKVVHDDDDFDSDPLDFDDEEDD